MAHLVTTYFPKFLRDCLQINSEGPLPPPPPPLRTQSEIAYHIGIPLKSCTSVCFVNTDDAGPSTFKALPLPILDENCAYVYRRKGVK